MVNIYTKATPEDMSRVLLCLSGLAGVGEHLPKGPAPRTRLNYKTEEAAIAGRFSSEPLSVLFGFPENNLKRVRAEHGRGVCDYHAKAEDGWTLFLDNVKQPKPLVGKQLKKNRFKHNVEIWKECSSGCKPPAGR
jgi:hypothetical protein